MPNMPTRKNIRLKNYNYSTTGTYFITICVMGRKNLLSAILIDNDLPIIELSKYGEIADNQIKAMNKLYDNITVEKYVIMPDHIHLLISTISNAASRQFNNNANSTISRFVETFKRFTNKAYGFNMWQSNYYDHIVRNEQDYNEIYKYIEENPIKRYYKTQL